MPPLRTVRSISKAAVAGRVDAQVLARLEPRRRQEVRHGLALRLLQVFDRRPDGRDGGVVVAEAEAGGGADVPLPRELFQAVPLGELPAGPADHALDAAAAGLAGGGMFLAVTGFRHEKLRRVEPRQLVENLGLVAAERRDPAGRQLRPRQSDAGGSPPRAAERQRRQVVAAPPVQQGVVGQRPRRHQPRHVALHQSLGLLGVLHLLANRHAVPGGDHPLQVALDAVERHAGHRHALRPLRQRDAQRPRRQHRVVVEQLVEVAHAEEQDVAGVLPLEPGELPHPRREVRVVGVRQRVGNRRRGGRASAGRS